MSSKSRRTGAGDPGGVVRLAPRLEACPTRRWVDSQLSRAAARGRGPAESISFEASCGHIRSTGPECDEHLDMIFHR
jgi:hypothetical protein